MFRFMSKPLPMLAVLFAVVIMGACVSVASGQGPGGATIAPFPHHYVPSEVGAGVAVDCGTDYPGIRGTYICNITQVGNTFTVTRQVPDTTDPSGVGTETLTFSLAAGQADGVVTAGAFDATNEHLNLTVTAHGTTSNVSIDVPAAVRAGAMFTNTAPANVVSGTGVAGTATTAARSDHSHGGDRQRSFGTHTPEAVASTGALGSNPTVARSDHRHAFGRNFGTSTPANVTTGAGAVGTANTLSRSDHVHGGDTDTDTTLSFGTGTATNVVSGTGVIGSSGDAARFDHSHGGDRQRSFTSHAPEPLGATAALGSNPTVQRSDHVHPGGDRLLPTGATDNQIASYDAGTSQWVAEDPPTGGGTGDISSVTAGAGLDGGGTSGAVTLSVEFGANTPEASTTATGAPGSATSVSRSDHRHQAPGGGGTGDITGITTPSNSGIGLSGCNSGECSVSLDVDGLLSLGLNGLDVDQDLVVADGSTEYKARLDNLSTYTLGRIDNLTDLSTLSNQDSIAVTDASDSHNPKEADLSNLSNYVGARLAGDNLTYNNSTNQLDASGGGGSTTFTGLTDTPAAITASQCVQGNSGGTALTFGACGTGGGGGATTFLGLSDTPGVYTGQGAELVRVNAGASALEFVPPPAPSHQILNVGRLPDPSVATSPELVYLTHDYTEGSQQDMTLTVGFEGNQAGYSDGNYLQDAFGSVNENSPLNAIIGAGDASDYSLQGIVSFNELWLDEFTHIEIAGTEYPLNPSFVSVGAYERRIQGFPTGLSAATLSINFKRADNTWYFTDGGDLIHEAGLYEKVGNPPAYHDLAPIEDTHRSGSGGFSCGDLNPPTDGGQVCIDSDGNPYFSTDRVVFVTTEPEITATDPFISDYWEGITTLHDLNRHGENGAFIYHPSSDSLIQIRGTRATGMLTITGADATAVPEGTVFRETGASRQFRTTADATITGTTVTVAAEAEFVGADLNIADGVAMVPNPTVDGVTSAVSAGAFTGGTGDGVAIYTWTQIWGYIADNDSGDTAAEQTAHDNLAADSVFLGEFAQTSEAAEDRDAYTVTTDRYFYLIRGAEGTLLEITGFTSSEESEQSEHIWRGPVITIEDVEDVFEVNAEIDPQERTFSSLRVGDNLYTAIVRPDEVTGLLRDPVAEDWDTHDSFSRSVAWDGTEWMEAQRFLEGSHSADGVFTEITPGTTVTLSTNGASGQARWRGENSSASPNINQRDGDFIYWTGGNTLRQWVVEPRAFSSAWHNRSPRSFLGRGLHYQGGFTNQDTALAHVTENGDRVIYQRTPERARGTIRFAGTVGADIIIGTRLRPDGETFEFEVIEGGSIPAGGQIDLDIRAVMGGSEGNVADNTIFTHSITGVTSATAEGPFTRGDDVTGGYRLYTVSAFDGASPAEYEYRWKSVVDVDEIELLIGPDRATGVLREATDDDFDEGHGQSRVVAFDGTHFQKASRRVVGGTGATGTWTLVADGTEIRSGRRWRDSHYQDYLVTSPQHGDVYYNLHTGFRDYDGSAWHAVGTALVFDMPDSPRYLGAFSTNQQASDFATADGQWALIYDSQSRPRMNILSGYAEAMPEHYEYFWSPVTVFPRIPPVPFAASNDQILRWSQSAGQWSPSQIATGATIDGIGTAGDPLVVNVNDVTETLQESISYHSSGDLNYTTRGATVAQIFSTGPYQTCVTRVRANIEGQSGSVRYTARLMRLNDNNNNVHTRLGNSGSESLSTTGFHSFDFSECVTIPTQSRVAVMISRTDGSNDSATFLRFGAEATNSPDESYDDASIDWNYVGWAEYEHTYPNVGHGTVGHDESDPDAYGDLQIRYRRVFDHGTLVGNGNVDLAHLNDDVTTRLLPGSPSDDQIAQYNSTTSAWEAVAVPTGSTTFTGLSDTPAAITANQCVAGNGTGTALVFGACGSGITQTQGDARYAQLGASNTFTAANTIDMDPSSGSVFEIDAREGTSTGAVFNVIVGETFRARKGFSISRNVGAGLTGWAWATFDYDECGNGQPGFSLGPGGDGENRDVEWCRSGANEWTTGSNDTITAGEFDVQSTGLAATQANLGIVQADWNETTATDLSFIQNKPSLVTAFTGLSDTPASITASQCVQGNGAGNALVFGACGTGAGSSTFLGLSDTPAAFGAAGQHVAVNAAADGLEFVAAPAGGTGGGILKGKHLVTSSMEITSDNSGWDTILTQAITVAAGNATDRVFAEANLVVHPSAAGDCTVRLMRDTTQVATRTLHFDAPNVNLTWGIAAMDTPGAGTFTYDVDIQAAASHNCLVNDDSATSHAIFELLAANP